MAGTFSKTFLATAMVITLVYIKAGREKLIGWEIETGENLAGTLGSGSSGGAFLIGNAEIIARHEHLNSSGKLNYRENSKCYKEFLRCAIAGVIGASSKAAGLKV